MFDLSRKGSFSKEDFLKIFSHSQLIEQDKSGTVRKNLDQCFQYLQQVYGNTEITPKEFADIINHGTKF